LTNAFTTLSTFDYKRQCVSYSKLSHTSRLSIQNPADGKTCTIKPVSPNIAQRSLGVLIAPDGDGRTQLRHSIQKARELFGKFKNASMTSHTKFIAVNSIVAPAILYPMVAAYFLDREISPINSILNQMQCVALGLNRNFPRAILHVPPSLGGLGLPSPMQKIMKLRVNYFFITYGDNLTTATS
jgi:hypothetical protein